MTEDVTSLIYQAQAAQFTPVGLFQDKVAIAKRMQHLADLLGEVTFELSERVEREKQYGIDYRSRTGPS